MNTLLNLLDKNYPLELTEREFEKLGFDYEFLNISDLFTLSAIRSEVSCDCLDRVHEIFQNEAGEYWYVCGADFEKVDKKDIAIWRFNIDPFLHQLSNGIGLTSSVTPVIPNRCWFLGNLQKTHTGTSLYFLRNFITESEYARLQSTNTLSVILVTDAVFQKLEPTEGFIIEPLSRYIIDDFHLPKKRVDSLLTIIEKHLFSQQVGNGTFSYKGIVVNENAATFQFEEYPPVTISPTIEPIRFIIFLIKKAAYVVQYIEIAKELNIGAYHENCTNEDVARNVQYLRRDLLNYLREKGLDEEAIVKIKKMIVNKRSRGFILS